MPYYGNETRDKVSFTSFDGIPFQVNADRSGVYAAWSADPIIVERHVPRGNRVYRQNMGYSLARLTVRLEFESIDDLRRFEIAHLDQREARLTLLANYFSVRGEPSTIHKDYEYFDWITIDSITDRETPVDRRCTCTATFASAFDPLTMKVTT